eukprot:TRINITY_DN38148_c0_g1_i1.p1 TRINITY_DN38148_c0_g1~~TRINITY_DN38148_c0_g1_i1.p1  ORF type:complete len:690 (-),score=188.04 TRINITY_DN38148_c0_g1_i1:442-2511(-)
MACAVGAVSEHRIVGKMAPDSAPLRPAKLFIGGLTRNTTTKQLRDHFSAYGRVLDCVAMRQPDGRPRGFGYVTLDTQEGAERAVIEPQIIDGRQVEMKRAVPEGSGNHLSSRSNMQMGYGSAHQLQTPLSPSALNMTYGGAWPEVQNYGYCGTPSAMHQPDLSDTFWNGAAAAAAAVAAAASAAAAAPKVAGYAADPLEILSSRSRALPTPLGYHNQDFSESSQLYLPETPTYSSIGQLSPTMSAAAPEFVPTVTSPQGGSFKARPRPVLGEITNTATNTVLSPKTSESLKAKKQSLSAAFPANFDPENVSPNAKTASKKVAMTPQEPGLIVKNDEGVSAKEASLKIDTENVEPAAVQKEPAEELSPLYGSEGKKSIAVESDDEEDDSDGEDLESIDEAIYDGKLPSIGSAEHRAGTCKRCNFFPKGRCQNGENCTFCHYPHEKRKPSRQEKRERRAAWASMQASDAPIGAAQAFEEPEVESDEQTFAYSMLPGLPLMRTAKLPSPLALPGASSNVCGGFSTYPAAAPSASVYPAPPPGLGPHQNAGMSWQPDEEVSPVGGRAPANMILATAPLLSTMPPTPSSHQTLSTTPTALQQVTALLASVEAQAQTPVATPAGSKPMMVTMGTQTADEASAFVAPVEDAEAKEARRSLCIYSKADLLMARGNGAADAKPAEGAYSLKAVSFTLD